MNKDRALCFASGLAMGFIVGSRAGRRAYDGMAGGAHKVWENQKVRDAATVVQAQASRLYDERIRRITPDGRAREDTPADVQPTEDAVS